MQHCQPSIILLNRRQLLLIKTLSTVAQCFKDTVMHAGILNHSKKIANCTCFISEVESNATPNEFQPRRVL